MTNWEKYSSKFNTTEFGLVNGKPVLCADIRCQECEWFGDDMECSPRQMKWLKDEYNDHEEKMKQAKTDLQNTLSSNILCDTYSHCSECPMYLLRGHKFDNSTCSTVVRAILAEGIKKVIGNE